MARTGTVYTQQVDLGQQASLPSHAIRNDDPAIVALRNSGLVSGGTQSGFVTAGYGPEQFGSRDPSNNGHTTVPNGVGVLINAEGKLTTATSTAANGDNTFAVKANDKYYFGGMIAFNFGQNLIPGSSYWLQISGAPSINPPTQPGEWAVKLGVAINSTDLLVILDTQGKLA